MAKKATARCHPDDKFDFEVGARLAFDRLMKSNKSKREFKIGDRVVGNKDANRYGITKQGYRGRVTGIMNESKHIEVDGFPVLADCFDLDTSFKPKYFNGKVVCTNAKSSLVTKGKIYEIKNGVIKFDDNFLHLFKPVQSVSELNTLALSSFIEIIE